MEKREFPPASISSDITHVLIAYEASNARTMTIGEYHYLY